MIAAAAQVRRARPIFVGSQASSPFLLNLPPVRQASGRSEEFAGGI
jgi:hypothetical protein